VPRGKESHIRTWSASRTTRPTLQRVSTTGDEALYGLGGIGPLPTFHLTVPLARDEFDELTEALNTVDALETPFAYRLVVRNYATFEDVYRFALTLLAASADQPRADHKALGRSLMGAVINWLTAFRLFLDHELTVLSRQFGRDSEQLTRFTSATSAAFDAEPGYRFIYKFRNYVQHCGLPLSNISVDLVDVGTESERPQARLELNRDDLLASYEDWGRPVRTDLHAMTPRFDLFPLAEGAMAGLRAVYRELLSIRLDHALSKVRPLEAALDRLEGLAPDEAPALLHMRVAGADVRGVTPRNLKPHAVRALADVVAGHRTKDSLFHEAEIEDDTLRPLHPQQIAAALRPQSPGLEVLSLFYAEHGASDRFRQCVDDLADDPDTSGALISGLIDAALLFSSMTATLLETDPGAMVAGLRAMYSHPPAREPIGDDHDPSTGSAQ
jgi:hypothetical protein